MTLSFPELIAALRREDLVVTAPADAPLIAGLTTDSRLAGSGDVYIAVRGSQTDGHRFVRDAVGRGAAAIVVETPQGLPVPERGRIPAELAEQYAAAHR